MRSPKEQRKDSLFGGFSMGAGIFLILTGEPFTMVLGAVTLLAGWGLTDGLPRAKDL